MQGSLIEAANATSGGGGGGATAHYAETAITAGFTNVGTPFHVDVTVPANAVVFFEAYIGYFGLGTSATYNFDQLQVFLDPLGVNLILGQTYQVYRSDQNNATTGGQFALVVAGHTPPLSAGTHRILANLSTNVAGPGDPLADMESVLRTVYFT